MPPGKYLLVGQRNGFRKQGYEQHGVYVSAVAGGQGLTSDNLVLRLRPDAWITGTIIDEDNEPVTNAVIYLFRADTSAGLRQTFLVAQTVADDRGYYRFAQLESGWSFVAISAQPWFGSLARQREAGGSLSPAERILFDVVYPPTFDPGVVDSASAQQIVLNEGEEFTADFALTAIPALRVRINHLNDDPEQPRGASLKQNVFGTQINPPSQGQTTVGDSVELTGIPPGEYVLDIQSYGAVTSMRSTVVNVAADLDLDENAPSPPSPILRTLRSLAARNP